MISTTSMKYFIPRNENSPSQPPAGKKWAPFSTKWEVTSLFKHFASERERQTNYSLPGVISWDEGKCYNIIADSSTKAQVPWNRIRGTRWTSSNIMLWHHVPCCLFSIKTQQWKCHHLTIVYIHYVLVFCVQFMGLLRPSTMWLRVTI